MTAPTRTLAICDAPGCSREHSARGFCRTHYERWRKHRNVLYQRPTPDQRFLTKIQAAPAPNGCHLWQGSGVTDGYGVLGVGGGYVRAHRYAWERVNGPIPEGLVIDHTCRVRRCVNVDHLRVVTRRINALENSTGVSALAARQVACKNGHTLGGVNVSERDKALGNRRCLKCSQKYNQIRREARNAKAV